MTYEKLMYVENVYIIYIYNCPPLSNFRVFSEMYVNVSVCSKIIRLKLHPCVKWPDVLYFYTYSMQRQCPLERRYISLNSAIHCFVSCAVGVGLLGSGGPGLVGVGGLVAGGLGLGALTLMGMCRGLTIHS